MTWVIPLRDLDLKCLLSKWIQVTVLRGSKEVRKLKEQPGINILLDGSSVLAHTLIENALVDEYALHVYPLVYGRREEVIPGGQAGEFEIDRIRRTSNRCGVSTLSTCSGIDAASLK